MGLFLQLFCSFFIFIGCNETLKTTFSEINISTEKNTIIEINIPKANGNEVLKNNINFKIEEIVIDALHTGNTDNVTSKSIEESISSFNEEYNNFKSDFPESKQQWEVQIDGEVIYESIEIISIAMTSYINTGGAHGSLHISFLNFNAETGHLILNNELFNDIEAFKKVAKPYFGKTIEEKYASEEGGFAKG